MDPIAIVGLDCVFPGADGIDAFWHLLSEGRDAVGTVPAQRWDARAYFDADPSAVGKIASTWGGFVDLESFDAEFFAIPRAEAEKMDPQHKLLLEVTYRALENAALPVKSLAGSATGVFVGV